MAAVARPAPALDDPYLFPLDFDLQEDEAVFVQTDWYELSARLRLSALDFPVERLRLFPNDVVVAAGTRFAGGCRVNFLFHMPFSGSTLLTRLLEFPDILNLRDPACLDALFQVLSDNAEERPITLHSATLGLLNRAVPGCALLVRTAGYHPHMFRSLATAPQCRSVLYLFDHLDTFLPQILKSEQRRADMCQLLGRRREEVVRRTGHLPETLSDAEIATVFWVSSATAFLGLDHPIARTIDSAHLMVEPESVALAVARLIGAGHSGVPVRTDLVEVHAKTGVRFSPARRAAEQDALRSRYAVEIVGAAPLAERLGVPDMERALRQRALS